MPIQIKDDGSFEIVYGGPWKGINVQAPPNLIDPAEAAVSNNWLLRNVAISSRPRFLNASIDLTGTNQLTGVGTFLSPGGFYHTFAFDTVGDLYNFRGDGMLPTTPSHLDLVTKLPSLAKTNPVNWRVINSTANTTSNPSGLYWVNGSQSVGYWDGTTGPVGGGAVSGTSGITAGTTTLAAAGLNYAANDTGTLTAGNGDATYKVLTVNGSGAVLTYSITAGGTGYTAGVTSATATGGAQPGIGTGLTIFINTVTGGGPQQNVVVVGATNIGAKYIGILAQHAILLNTVGTADDGPFTIRYSAIGLPCTFDPSVNINAGFYKQIDFADEISGAMFFGRVAWVFHRTGITEMAPTGIGTNPFEFNHIWNAQDGAGSIYPYTMAQYGLYGAFVSTEQVYFINNFQVQPIGGNARDAILFDIHTSQQQLGASSLVGVIAPAYDDNFSYTVYQIYIPLAMGGPTAVWQYNIEIGYWERLILTGELVGGIPAFCLVR